MAAQNILESVVFSIRDQIKDNISSYLNEVKTERPDGNVSLEVPVEYFIYEDAIGYKTPAIFVVADSVDFRLSRGPNHINAAVKVYVSCVVEDRLQRLLTLKCFRYQDALHKCLDRVHLLSKDQRVQNVVKVTRVDISSSQKKNMSSTDSPFRKEIMLTLEVEHYEGEN